MGGIPTKQFSQMFISLIWTQCKVGFSWALLWRITYGKIKLSCESIFCWICVWFFWNRHSLGWYSERSILHLACSRGRALDLGSGMTFEDCLTLDSEVLWHLTFSSEAGGKDVDHRRAVGRRRKYTDVTVRLRVLAPHPNSVLLSVMDDSKQSWFQARVCSVLSCRRKGGRWTHVSVALQPKLSPPQAMRPTVSVWPFWKCDAFLLWKNENNPAASSVLNLTVGLHLGGAWGPEVIQTWLVW